MADPVVLTARQLNALVNLALFGPAGLPPETWYPLRWRSEGPAPCWVQVSTKNAIALGNLLQEGNWYSVANRSMLAGLPSGQLRPKGPFVWNVTAPRPTAVEGLWLCALADAHCAEGVNSLCTEAVAVLEALRGQLIHALPGYAEAEDTWGTLRPRATLTLLK